MGFPVSLYEEVSSGDYVCADPELKDAAIVVADLIMEQVTRKTTKENEHFKYLADLLLKVSMCNETVQTR